MPTGTTRPIADGTLPDTTLHVAFDLGNTEWTFACSPAVAVALRVRTMSARDLPRLVAELEAARRHFGLPSAAPIRTCDEAGRDGFWLHRALAGGGIPDVIVDSASIEVNRRARPSQDRSARRHRAAPPPAAVSDGRDPRVARGARERLCPPSTKRIGGMRIGNSSGSHGNTRAA